MAFCWLDSTVSTAPPPALAGLLEPSFELFELDPVLETPPHAASAAATTRAQQPALSVLYVLLRSIERAPPDTNVVSICGPPGPCAQATASRVMRPRVRPGALAFSSSRAPPFPVA